MILAIFDQQVTPICPIKFLVNWNLSWEEEVQMDFQDDGSAGHLEFRIGTIFTIFDLH